MDITTKILELCTDFELDDVTELTIVMSKHEVDAILAIDAMHAARDSVHMRPTITMNAVKIIM